MRKWVLAEIPPKEFTDTHPELPPIVARLLWNRNLRTQEQIDEFLNPDYSADVHDPFLFRQMPRAVEIIFSAIENHKKIFVHGDYDADGVCSAAILFKTLKALGAENLNVFLPHRETDGYGLNMNTVNGFIEQKVDLVITCDCGISNVEHISALKNAGIQTVITDHHMPQEELPPADAIIHALVPGETYPDKGLPGAGVAFKLAQGLLHAHEKQGMTLPGNQTHESFEKWLLDLVAIAAIGDMVPLVGESRTLTRYGLTVLNKSRNLGLKSLFVAASLLDEDGRPRHGAFDAQNISFQIVPRLNAAGRMDHANTAFALLMAEDNKEAAVLAEQLNKNNTDRQKMTEQLVNQAVQQIKETKQSENFVLFAYNEDWPAGLLGLVSGKIKDVFYKPSFALTKIDGEYIGSARSIPEFNLMTNLESMHELFIKFGGHPQACGVSIKSKKILDEFQSRINFAAEKELKGKELAPHLTIDAEVNLEDVDWKLYDILQKFEPFGQANEEPLYLASGLTVIEINPVGQDGKHLKLMVKHNSHLVKKTIAFGFGDANKHPADWKNTLKPGDKIDLVFTVSVNEWNGNRELELAVKDMRKSEK